MNNKAGQLLCPICKKNPQSPEYRPFCSKRCADIDLHRWLGGVYAIPGDRDEEAAHIKSEDDEQPES